jgi:hypothetical protein
MSFLYFPIHILWWQKHAGELAPAVLFRAGYGEDLAFLSELQRLIQNAEQEMTFQTDSVV